MGDKNNERISINLPDEITNNDSDIDLYDLYDLYHDYVAAEALPEDGKTLFEDAGALPEDGMLFEDAGALPEDALNTVVL
ncbi:2091_t:CDS:2 [Racocetra fulgida]|uniref:2091_t:CDS:1 n=1 Tax=Racocetra fulgida TaxID=60492 RepID=A0A9N8VUY7_9GLOM|nr:2091_t:CDS:2 [Racocetra fulgida]